MNLGLLRSITALNQQPLPEPIGKVWLRSLRMRAIHQPGHQLMSHQREINVPLGMTRKTEFAFQPLQGRSDPVPAELIGVSIHSGNGTPPLQFTATQDLQGCGQILLTTDTTAIGSKQNQLGSI